MKERMTLFTNSCHKHYTLEEEDVSRLIRELLRDKEYTVRVFHHYEGQQIDKVIIKRKE